MTSNESCKPLVVDLDGTLIKTDMLFETGMDYLKNNPLDFWKPLFEVKKGKPALKQLLAMGGNVDVTVLPYNDEVLEEIQVAKESGREVVLATATYLSLAEKISDHLGIFDRVIATQDSINLSGKNKQDALVELYGEKGFDYIGNSKDDIPVWESSCKSIVVNAKSSVESKAKKVGNVEKIINNNTSSLNTWRKALRMHQWLKNALIFVPLLAAHKVTDPVLFSTGILAFLFFGLCASSVYILNDLLDLSDDRHHKTKCQRPFASGKLSITSGLLVFPVLLLTSFIGSALLLPIEFIGVLLGYYILTLAYSFGLKRIMTIDVIALALLYTVRILAGAAAFELELTFWILAFSMFIFLSLALVKRYAELKVAKDKGKLEKTRGRGYYPSDLEMVSSLGAASGYLSVLVLALYINDSKTTELYSNLQLAWLTVPLLMIWITRTWMLTHRGEMNDDPVVFAVKDKASLVIGALFISVFGLAI